MANTATVETVALTNTPSYKRLTRSDVGMLLKLHKDGKTQTEIAQLLGCTQGTVSQWLSRLADTTDPAKQYLRGQALRMAQNVVSKGKASDHVNALKGLGVLEEQQIQGITVIVGGVGSVVTVPGVMELSPPVVTIESESVQNP